MKVYLISTVLASAFFAPASAAGGGYVGYNTMRALVESGACDEPVPGSDCAQALGWVSVLGYFAGSSSTECQEAKKYCCDPFIVDGLSLQDCRPPIGFSPVADGPCSCGEDSSTGGIAVLDARDFQTTGTGDLYCCDSPNLIVRECAVDCDENRDCSPGFVCAETTKQYLVDACGLDARKAYCELEGADYTEDDPQGVKEVCYDPSRYGCLLDPPDTPAECYIDCNVDEDCPGDLWCADAHKNELGDAGCDKRKAYCKEYYYYGNVDPQDVFEACYDPDLVSFECYR